VGGAGTTHAAGTTHTAATAGTTRAAWTAHTAAIPGSSRAATRDVALADAALLATHVLACVVLATL